MHRSLRRIALAVSMTAALAASATSVTAAPPAARYTAEISSDSACLLTVKATWKGADVAHIFLFWYMDGTYLATSEAPNSGPNGGTIRGKTATLRFGPATPTETLHAWHANVQFYSAAGVNLNVTDSNIIVVGCTVG